MAFIVWIIGSVVWAYSAIEKEHQLCLFIISV